MAIPKLTLSDLDLNGKRVLVRADFNVPLGDEGEVANDARIRASVPTIRELIDGGAIPILMTHLGRPKGKVVDSMRLDPVARRLAELQAAYLPCISTVSPLYLPYISPRRGGWPSCRRQRATRRRRLGLGLGVRLGLGRRLGLG